MNDTRTGKDVTAEILSTPNITHSAESAIGYAKDFEMYTPAGYGIGKGNWNLPSINDALTIILPNLNTIKYALSLFGQTLPEGIWLCQDASATSAHTFKTLNGGVESVTKSTPYGVLLMAKVPSRLQTKSV